MPYLNSNVRMSVHLFVLVIFNSFQPSSHSCLRESRWAHIDVKLHYWCTPLSDKLSAEGGSDDSVVVLHIVGNNGLHNVSKVSVNSKLSSWILCWYKYEGLQVTACVYIWRAPDVRWSLNDVNFWKFWRHVRFWVTSQEARNWMKMVKNTSCNALQCTCSVYTV